MCDSVTAHPRDKLQRVNWPADSFRLPFQVASTSGDVRRALELLRRSVDAAEDDLRELQEQGKAPPDSLDAFVVVGRHHWVLSWV